MTSQKQSKDSAWISGWAVGYEDEEPLCPFDLNKDEDLHDAWWSGYAQGSYDA